MLRTLVFQEPAPMRPVESLSFRGDGKVLAAAVNHKVMLWSMDTGKNTETLDGDFFECVAFSTKGDKLIAGGCNGHGGVLSIWDLKHNNRLVKVERYGPDIASVTVSPHDDVVAAGGRRRDPPLGRCETKEDCDTSKPRTTCKLRGV